MTQSATNDSSGTGRVSLREEQKRLTRRKLIDAAREVFAEKGYADATIDDVVENAGASRGTYYLYFRNKTEVLGELIEGYTEKANEHLAALADIDEPSVDDLREWLAGFVDLYGDYRMIIRAWIQAESNEPELHEVTDRNLNRFLDVLIERLTDIRSRRDKEKVNPKEIRVRAVLMLVQVERFCYFWHIRGWKIDRAVALSTMAELWHHAMYGDTR